MNMGLECPESSVQAGYGTPPPHTRKYPIFDQVEPIFGQRQMAMGHVVNKIYGELL